MSIFRHVLDGIAPSFVTDQWLVPGLIPRDGLVILASAPKTGKTCFATALARAVATGGEFLEHRLEKAPVLWCAHEETPRERLPLYEGLTEEDPLYVAYPDMLPMLDAPIPKRDRYGRYRLEDAAEPYVYNDAVELGAKLLVVDCLHASVERGNLAENGFAREVMGRLRRWSYNFHVPTLVLHHLTKSATRGHHPERFADSAQILAASSCHFFMERHTLSGGASRVVLHGRGRFPAPPARQEFLSRGPLSYEVAPETVAQREKETLEERILNALEDGDGLTARELSLRLASKYSGVRNAVTDLASRGLIAPSALERPTRYSRCL